MYTLVHSRMVSATSSAVSAYASMLANFLPANAVLTPGGMTSSEVESDDSGRICISSIVGVMLGSRVVNEASFLSFCDLVRPNCKLLDEGSLE